MYRETDEMLSRVVDMNTVCEVLVMTEANIGKVWETWRGGACGSYIAWEFVSLASAGPGEAGQHGDHGRAHVC